MVQPSVRGLRLVAPLLLTVLVGVITRVDASLKSWTLNNGASLNSYHSGTLTLNVGNFTLTIDKNVQTLTVQGTTSDFNNHVIDMRGQYRVGGKLSLRNVHLKGNRISKENGGLLHSGDALEDIYTTQGGDVHAINCKFSNGKSNKGGLMYLKTGRHRFMGCTFTGGSASDGNAIFCGGDEQSITGAGFDMANGQDISEYGDQTARTASSECKACPTGRYGDQTARTASGQCKVCPTGTYGDQTARTASGQCKVCPSGTYGDQTGQQQCKACGTGRYSGHTALTASGQCKACPTGTYGDQTARTASGQCKVCSTGTYGDQTGQQQCKACGTGRFADQTARTASGQCEACGKGRYGDQAVQGACKPCGAGKYGHLAAQASEGSCAGCAKGKYHGQAAQTAEGSCKDCPQGTFQDEAAQARCKDCARGTYQGQTAQTAQGVCKGCVKGLYQDQLAQAAASSCKDCAKGRYQDQLAQGAASACKACGKGLYLDQAAQISEETCKDCAAGKYSSLTAQVAAGACSNCTIGKYNDKKAQTSVDACTSCAAGHYGTAPGQALCTPCATGHYTDTTQSLVCKQCSAGHFAGETGTVKCEQCAKGRFQSQKGREACKQCDQGKTTEFAASTAPYDCECDGAACCGPGTFLESSDSCANCPTGKFQETSGATTCEDCPEGTFQDVDGQTYCLQCPPGRFDDVGGRKSSNDCQPCAAGRSFDAVGGAACKACKAGEHQPRTGTASCIACQPGQYSGPAAAECRPCPAGRFGDDATEQDSEAHCRNCPAGKFQENTKKLFCVACGVGKVGDASRGASLESTQCVACAAGKFQSGIGGTGCNDCVDGKYQAQEGKTFCVSHQDCAAGSYVANMPGATADRVCAKCSTNAVDASFSLDSNAGSCEACALHTCSGGLARRGCGGASEGYCASCIPGTWLDGVCKDCPAGKYSSKENAGECTECEVGKYQPGAKKTLCVACGLGKAGLALRGKSSEAEQCAKCLAGTFQPSVGGTGCDGCPPGQYQDGEEQAVCKLRPDEGRTTKVSTLSVAAAVGTPVGDTNDRLVQITAEERCPESHFAYKGKFCVSCPERGAVCDDGVILLQEGFWYDYTKHGNLSDFWYAKQQSTESSADVQLANIYQCPIGSGQCMVDAQTGLPACKENHGGPLCGVCNDGYYSEGTIEGCSRCPSGGETASSIIAFLAVLYAFAKAMRELWRRLRLRYPNMDLTRMTYEMPQIIKLVTGVFQIVGSFQESFHSVPWPDSFKAMMSYFGAVFSFDFFGQPVFACTASGDTFAKRFLWHTLTVLFIALLMLGFLVRTEMVKRYRQQRALLWNLLLPFLFIVYPSISKTVILMLRCREIDGAVYLLADYKVRCDQAGYDHYHSLAVFFTLLYPVGIPVLFTFVLARNRHKLPPDWWPNNLEDEEDRAFTEFRSVRGNEWAERAEL
eukprot:g4264.t1